MYTVAAFYKFLPIPDPTGTAARLRRALWCLGVSGSLLIASEGINGTLVATHEKTVDVALDQIAVSCGLPVQDLKAETKRSYTDITPFKRLKVLSKPEIIVFNQPDFCPTHQRVGQYVMPKDWNALIDKEDVTLVDTRNVYETCIGTFAGAIVPPLKKFTEFMDFVRKHLSGDKEKKIAMFCTGGIRCEKASHFLLQEGFTDVYQLQGGILRYLEEVPQSQSRWQG